MLVLLAILFITIFTAIYFVPSFIAICRKHSHVLQITILNTFLGWSFIAWVASLIWATTNNIDENVSTKGSKIIILACFLCLIIPPILFSMVPQRYKTQTMNQIQIRQTDYVLNHGKVKEYTKVKNIEYKN